MAGGGDGADWGQVLLPRRRSSRGIGERARAEAEGQEVGSCNDGADNVGGFVLARRQGNGLGDECLDESIRRVVASIGTCSHNMAVDLRQIVRVHCVFDATSCGRNYLLLLYVLSIVLGFDLYLVQNCCSNNIGVPV